MYIGYYAIELVCNKKVLLRERKRHTNRGISSTPSVSRSEARPGLTGGYLRWGTSPSRGTPLLYLAKWATLPPAGGTPPPSRGCPPGQVGWGVPEVGYLPIGVPFPRLARPDLPPPRRCGPTNKVKLLPPSCTTCGR